MNLLKLIREKLAKKTNKQYPIARCDVCGKISHPYTTCDKHKEMIK